MASRRRSNYTRSWLSDELTTAFGEPVSAVKFYAVPIDARYRLSRDYSEKMVDFARIHLSAYSWDQIEEALKALSLEARHELSTVVLKTLESNENHWPEDLATEGRKIILESLTALEQKNAQMAQGRLTMKKGDV